MSRPAQNIYKFLSPTDNQLLTFLKKAHEFDATRIFNVQIAPGVTIKFEGDPSEITSKLSKEGKGRQILRATFQVTPTAGQRSNSTYSFDRGVTKNNALHPSVQYAEVFFSSPQSNAELSRKVANLIEQSFKTSVSSSSSGDATGLGIFVTQLAEVSTSISENLAQTQLKAEQKAQERLAKLDEQSDRQRESVEQERTSLQKEYKDKSDELDAREADLNNARARSERRGLRESINKALRKSLEEEISPKSAKFARYPIVTVALIGLAFSLFFAFFSFDQFAELIKQISQSSGEGNQNFPVVENSAINWLFASLLIRGSIGLGAATFFGYYLIRYFKNLEETANRRALELERYLFDIDRASWVIETIMELKEEEGISSIPEPWLKGATHNLFGSDGVDKDHVTDPLEALGELLSSGAKLKVGNGTAELDIQPKAAKKIVKKSS